MCLTIRVSQDVKAEVEAEAGAGDAVKALLDALAMLLWPRFKALLDAHVASLRRHSLYSLYLYTRAKTGG